MDIREEILRKRRAGKLPGDTTSLLKAWWQAHSKWPYPTVSLDIHVNHILYFRFLYSNIKRSVIYIQIHIFL